MSLVHFYQLEKSSNYIDTASTTERTSLLGQGWVELVSPTSDIYTGSSDYSGSVALYRVTSSGGATFYTTSSTIVSELVAAGWTNNGAAGYVMTTQPSGWGPLNYAYNSASGYYIFTASASQWSGLGASWVKSSTPACYVPNPAS